jgi:flagellar hook-length control protein FliK
MPSARVEPPATARVEPQVAGLASSPSTAPSAAHTVPATETVAATTQPSVPAVPVAPLQPTASASPLTVTLAMPAPATPAPATPQAAFAAQVSPTLFTLAGAKAGEHVMTINVAPDNLGPVTVRAHVTVDTVRVELFAPTDAGRDALRAILPDLRRDLAGSGLHTNLELSSHNEASDSGSDPSRQKTPAPHARVPLEREGEPAAEPGTRPHRIPSTSTIDVLA